MALIVLAAACVTLKPTNGSQESILVADCAVDPSSPGCHRPSFLDMINGINNRAQVYIVCNKLSFEVCQNAGNIEAPKLPTY